MSSVLERASLLCEDLPPKKRFAVSYLRVNTRIAKQPRIFHLTGGYAPAQVCAAYGFVWNMKVTKAVKIGIVSLGGSFNPATYKTAATQWSLPAPSFQQIVLTGADTSSDPGGANVENDMDVELSAAAYSYCTGQPASVVACSAPNSDTGIADAVNALVKAGCGVISCSWGAPLSQWSAAGLATTRAAWANAVNAGTTNFAASGDNSKNDGTNTGTVDYPCSDPNVWAMGGTSLMLNSTGGIASEKAWGDGAAGDEGGGGGFDTTQAQPTWQIGIVPSGKGRGVPDSSLNADPATGYAILSDGQWGVVGGTSAASPMQAGYIAYLQAAGGQTGLLTPKLYQNAGVCCNDITVGSNGFPATKGWDPATGNGSVNGRGMASVFLSAQPVPPPAPPPTPPPPPAMTLAQEINDVFAKLEAANPQNKWILDLIKAYLLQFAARQANARLENLLAYFFERSAA